MKPLHWTSLIFGGCAAFVWTAGHFRPDPGQNAARAGVLAPKTLDDNVERARTEPAFAAEAAVRAALVQSIPGAFVTRLFGLPAQREAATAAWRVLGAPGSGPIASTLRLAGTESPNDQASAAQAASTGTPSGKDQKHKKTADEFFAGPIVRLAIEMEKEEYDRLRRDNRSYSEARLTEQGTKLYKGVAVKLKGAAGSFQGVEGKPGLTLSFDKFKGAERFHGMKRLHLNNCVQDSTYLNELIAGEMARKAGIPASRCTHAFVSLNGRDLGLYVLKEGFTKDFLSYFFNDPNGNLYDGGLCREIDLQIEKDQGDPKDKSDIKELIAACHEADAARRWERLGKILNVDEFISFMAMEALLCHWDGYNFNRNNYRLYNDPETGRFSFMMHGMDQMFADPNFPLMRDFGAMVGSAVMRCPEGRRAYVARLESIYTNVLQPIDWPERVVQVGNKLRDALAARNPQWARDFESQINTVRRRVSDRIATIARQLGQIPKPVEFDSHGVLQLAKGWRTEGDAARLDEEPRDNKPALHIRAEGETTASWRQDLALEPGRYRFEAKACTAGVVASKGGSGEGAGIRISGGNRHGVNALAGDQPWQPIHYEFTVSSGAVVLVAELRAAKGDVWFDTTSLRLLRVK